MGSHADAETPGASSQGRAPNAKADAGGSGAARTADGKSDLTSSIMTILKSDAPVHDEESGRGTTKAIPAIATGRKSSLRCHQAFTLHSQQAKPGTRGCLEKSMTRSCGGHTFTFTYKYRYRGMRVEAPPKEQAESRVNGIDAWPFTGALPSAMPTAEAVLCEKKSRRNRCGVGKCSRARQHAAPLACSPWSENVTP